MPCVLLLEDTHLRQRRRCCLQALYIDIDTLWLAPPQFVWQHFEAMDAGGALFGMTEETTFMNEEGSWYAGGKVHIRRLQKLQHSTQPRLT